MLYTALGGVGFVHILPRPPPIRSQGFALVVKEGRLASPLTLGPRRQVVKTHPLQW